MIKSKLLYFLLVLLFPAVSYCCLCANEGVVNNFQQSEFVAKAKILKITLDPTNSDYHDAVIEIITLYKGERLSDIKIMSLMNTSCIFLPEVNSTWIIFGQRWQQILSFGLCSGSLRMDPTFDNVKYPNGGKIYGKTLKRKEGVISFLSRHKLLDPNPNNLRAFDSELGLFKGYKNKNSFAVFQVDVNADLSIAAVRQLKKFQNGKLNRLVLNSLKTKMTIGKLRGRKSIAKPAKLILVCYFYQENGSGGSVSIIDV